MSYPLDVKWTPSLKNSPGLSYLMWGCSITAPFKLQTNVAITLLTNFLVLSILAGLTPALHLHLGASNEKKIFMPGCRWWSWCRSSFILFTILTLLTSPMSFDPQLMMRTSGAALPRRELEKKGRRPVHRSPPDPNQWMQASGTPRLLPMVSAALWAPRRTWLSPMIHTVTKRGK